MKKAVSLLLLLSLFYSPSFAQSARDSFSTMRDIVMDLQKIQEERESLEENLMTANEEQKIEIERLQEDLNWREQERLEQLRIYTDLENYAKTKEDSLKRSQKKLTFWRVTSGTLAALSLILGIVLIAKK